MRAHLVGYEQQPPAFDHVKLIDIERLQSFAR
jgi:hypothetical protein